MEFTKLSKWEKWFLKYTNKKKYNQYKHWLFEYRQEQKVTQRTAALSHPDLRPLAKAIISFKHSGNSGDIIYSLPAAFALAQTGKIHFYLNLNRPGVYPTYHPLGNVMLNEKMMQMLKPLLLHQPQIEAVEEYGNETIDYDLDSFRDYPLWQDRGNIIHWYFAVYGISYDTSKPWLIAPKDEAYQDTIVIARSHRYRSPLIDYGFLKKYPAKIFIGVREEYEDMKKALPDLEFKPVKDFLEMATIINSCKLFIGNQSFPFSLAEALKAKRLLEVYYRAPNVSPEGPNANLFMYQPQFEYAVERLLKQRG